MPEDSWDTDEQAKITASSPGPISIGYRVTVQSGGKCAESSRILPIESRETAPEYNRLGMTDPTSGLLSRGSQVRILPGAPFLFNDLRGFENSRREATVDDFVDVFASMEKPGGVPAGIVKLPRRPRFSPWPLSARARLAGTRHLKTERAGSQETVVSCPEQVAADLNPRICRSR